MSYPTLEVAVDFTYGAAFGTAFVLDSATTGILDTDTLSQQVWTDVTQYAKAFSVRRGASRADGPVLRFEAGTVSITLDNSDRRFDPTWVDDYADVYVDLYTGGPYVAAGVSSVTPMRPVRIRATWNGTTYPVFQGYADAWQIDYAEPFYSSVTLTATDATKVLSNSDRVALGSPVGAGESSGARVNRVLDSVVWPQGADYRDIDTGNSGLQGTTMDRSVWEELLAVQDSEIGRVYVDAAGRVVFRERLALMEDPSSAMVQGAFGDQVGQLPFVDAVTVYDDTTINNLVRVSNTGGTQQIAEDTVSQGRYLVHTFDRTDLILQTDAEAANYASFVLFQTKDPELRFTAMTVTPHDDPNNLWPQVLGRDFGDRVSLTRKPPGGGSFSREMFVMGVSHSVDGPNHWSTTWTLASAAKWAFMTLDNPSTGLLDVDAIAF